ncbi:MAG: [protein-PII] uridylyltransferase, partial [Desulfobacterales bacterium]
GHATRSIDECIDLAKTDVGVLLSLLDARFIAGMSRLHLLLMDRLRESISGKQSVFLMNWIFENSQTRHRRFGDSTYLLEPNLKEGQGGLRDYHAMIWVARIKSNALRFEDFESHGYLTHDELYQLREALEFIWYVRNHLHHLAGRRSDQLHFEHQIRLAKALKYQKAEGQQPVERFLGKLHGQMEFIKQQHLVFFYEQGYLKPPKDTKTPRKQTRAKGLEINRDGVLGFTVPEVIADNPGLLLKIFEESARLNIPLSADAGRSVREFGHLVDGTFATSPSTIRSFERILVTPTTLFNVLDEMLSTGLLVRLIPEMQGIVDRIQYNEYHLYPVDKHSLRAVRTIQRFDSTEQREKDPLAADLYRDLKYPKLLLWAALLHDIGKGASREDHAQKGAEMAPSILADRGFKKRETGTISFLVREHLLLAKTATRRDINDEEIAILCARIIQDPERLTMLYLLTIADAQATGPKAWSDWTATLLRTLFLKILGVLEKGELASRKAVKTVEKKKARVLAALAGKELGHHKALVDALSPRYLLYVSAKEMLGHIALYNRLEDKDFVWEIAESSDSSTRTVTLCAKDRPGTFSKIAGVFTLHNVDILDCQVYTWRNNIALDIFEVTPPPDPIFEKESWQRAETDLLSALSGDLDLGTALAEKLAYYRWSTHPNGVMKAPQIIVDNNNSSFFTIIDVFTYDAPGLLYGITDALYKCGLDIWIAKIGTKIDQVVDVFYVRDFSGQKIDSPDKVAEIKAAIEQVLPGIAPGLDK